MWTNIPALRSEHELRTTGPYAVTRHPIYTGVLLMLLGTTLAFGAGSYLAALAAGAAGLIQNMHAEEKLLVHAFGARYEAYRRAVPALIPIPRMRKQRALA
jgi:protein-S-isoprenylcysteine O-methyltransferase Ste14